MIYENIKKRCDEENITISQLEKELKIGNGVIRHWNSRSPRVDLLNRVAQYLGVTVDDLLKSDEEKVAN